MKSPRITNLNIKLSTIITSSPFTILHPSLKQLKYFHLILLTYISQPYSPLAIRTPQSLFQAIFNTIIMENMLTHKLIDDLIFLIIFTTYRTIQLFIRVFIIYFLNHVFLFKWSTFFQFLLYFSLPN